VLMADNLAAICEPMVQTMWGAQNLNPIASLLRPVTVIAFYVGYSIPCVYVNMSVELNVLTTVIMNVVILWNITLSSPYVNRRFRGTYYLHLQGGKSTEQETSLQEGLVKISCRPGYQLYRVETVRRGGSDPEDGGDTFLRNVCSHTDYMALYPRRWQHS
jgi:hypothetical protein